LTYCSVYFGRSKEYQNANNITTNGVHAETHIYIEKYFISRCQPASDFLFKHNVNIQDTIDRIQILLVFCNTKFKYVGSKLEIHKLQDKLH